VKRSARVAQAKAAITMKYVMNGVEKLHKGHMTAGGEVIFPHPQNPDYDVISPTLAKTQLWLKCYYCHLQEDGPPPPGSPSM
jgi:hypothetical protein